jgi:hypothetical protein
MGGNGRTIAGSMEFESDASVRNAFVGLVKARDVRISDAGAGFVAAGGNFSILNGGCGPVIANGGVTIRNGGCGPMIANGNVSIEHGGTQSILAAGNATIGSKAIVGLVVSPKVTVEDGGKVLMGPSQAALFGAAAGVVGALVLRLIRR